MDHCIYLCNLRSYKYEPVLGIWTSSWWKWSPNFISFFLYHPLSLLLHIHTHIQSRKWDNFHLSDPSNKNSLLTSKLPNTIESFIWRHSVTKWFCYKITHAAWSKEKGKLMLNEWFHYLAGYYNQWVEKHCSRWIPDKQIPWNLEGNVLWRLPVLFSMKVSSIFYFKL